MAISPGGRPADDSPLGSGDNWVTRHGGLPKYIREVAHALLKTHTESEAIAIAVQKMRDWAAGGDHVRPQVQAAAAKALAEWEALKGSTKLSIEPTQALELAGAFNPALHPRAGGKFTPTYGAVAPTGGATETVLPPAVQQSLATWQAANGLPVTGQYDTATQASLLKAASGKPRAAKQPKQPRTTRAQVKGHPPVAKRGTAAQVAATAKANTVHLSREHPMSAARTRGRATKPLPATRTRAPAAAIEMTTPANSSADGPTITVLALAKAAPRLPKLANRLNGHAKAHRTRAMKLFKAGDVQGAKKALARARLIESMTKKAAT